MSKSEKVHKLVMGGMSVADASKKLKASASTYYHWRKKTGNAPKKRKKYTRRQVGEIHAIPLSDSNYPLEIKGSPRDIAKLLKELSTGGHA